MISCNYTDTHAHTQRIITKSILLENEEHQSINPTKSLSIFSFQTINGLIIFTVHVYKGNPKSFSVENVFYY